MGKIYYSPHSAFQFIIRPRREIFEGGVKTGEVRELLAEFAVHRGEYTYTDPDGNTQIGADISGHYFDLDSFAEMKDWDDEEKALAEKRLDQLCRTTPSQIRLWTKPAAPKPWAKYDETPWGKVAELAEAFGCIPEALAYEQENENRKGVIDALNKLFPTEVVEELTAA